MDFIASLNYCFILSISISSFWYAIGGEIILSHLVQFKPFICNYAAVCATSNPSRTFAVRSKAQCTGECLRHRESCVGVNYLDMNNTCELFTDNPTDFSQTVSGCEYIQMKSDNNVLCYEFGFQTSTMHYVRAPGNLLGSALINGQLFQTRYGFSQVFVYDTTTFQQLRTFTVPGLSTCASGSGTAADAVNNLLYIGDWSTSRMNRVNLSVTISVSVVTWNLPDKPQGVSLTRAGNVLVAFTNLRQINEYTPSGSLVRTVTNGNVMRHAVEVENGIWAVSRWGPVHGIALISTNGTVIKSFGSTAGNGLSQMNIPYGMAVDTNGYIIVADYSNNRVLVVDPSFTKARELHLPANTALQNPITIMLDQTHGRLYVGEASGLSRILVIDGN